MGPERLNRDPDEIAPQSVVFRHPFKPEHGLRSSPRRRRGSC